LVGATGNLGGRVVHQLLALGKPVRALVREGSHSTKLVARGVEIVRGDLRDRPSIDRALVGAYAVVTTAQGYIPRRRGDLLSAVDDRGNRNLVDAARAARVERFVFTSILTCDRAAQVPHFWQKKVIEDYLAASGVPFVALRPGALIAPPPEPGGRDWWTGGLKKGRIAAWGNASTRWTYVHIDDVARFLALAVDDPRVMGTRIDLGTDRPVSVREIAAVFSKFMGREVRVSAGAGRFFLGMMKVMSLFPPGARDMLAMVDHFEGGTYVAGTRAQSQYFGEVATVEDSLARYLLQVGLLASKVASTAAAPRPAP
jgi:uncharacterized protein YbjT (DUF2867 family)